MGKFPELMKERQELVKTIVCCSRDKQARELQIAHGLESGFLGSPDEGDPTVCVPLPYSGDWEVLVSHGLIHRKEVYKFLLLQVTLDYADYLNRSRFRRWWIDFFWDLGHDDTFRSKLAWAILTAAVSVGISVLLTR